MDNLILVSNWEQVDKDDFYLTDEWKKRVDEEDTKTIIQARDLQRNGKLFIAYIVDAKNYAIYRHMDADQVFINSDSDIILHCESAIIDNKHDHRIALNE